MMLPSPLLIEHDIRSNRHNGVGDAVLNHCFIASVDHVRRSCFTSNRYIFDRITSFSCHDDFEYRYKIIHGPNVRDDNGV